MRVMRSSTKSSRNKKKGKRVAAAMVGRSVGEPPVWRTGANTVELSSHDLNKSYVSFVDISEFFLLFEKKKKKKKTERPVDLDRIFLRFIDDRSLILSD